MLPQFSRSVGSKIAIISQCLPIAIFLLYFPFFVNIVPFTFSFHYLYMYVQLTHAVVVFFFLLLIIYKYIYTLIKGSMAIYILVPWYL